MGSKDFVRSEKKKPKKGAVKPAVSILLEQPVEVEVARKKGKKPTDFPEEQ